jgi:tetratricopeptide (TPR) repeat protein
MAILAALGFLYQHLRDMDRIFFQRSSSGAKALLLYLVGDYAGAARAYRNHFRHVVTPGVSVGAPATYAIIAGDLDRAERLARTRLEREPAEVESLVALGEIALERGALDEATSMFRRALARSPDNLDALMLSSVAYARAGAYGDAIDTINRALRHHDVDTRLTVLLAVMETTGDLARQPAGERPLCLLGHYHRYLRIFDPSHARLAARYAAQAIAAGDRVADAYVTVGVIHEKAHRPDEALAAFARAAMVDPKHAEAYRRAAVIYADRGDDVRAFTMARAAFEAAPGDPFYIEILDHVVMERLADPHQVVALLGRALEVNPSNVRAHDRLGYAYGFLGDQERSIAHYRTAIALEPRNAILYEGLGWALDRLGRADDAIAAYRQAVDVEPGRYQSHTALGSAYHRRHQYREAVAAYEEALRLGDPSVDTLASLCAMYHTTSDFRRAAPCFERVLARDPGHALAQRLIVESQTNLRLERERR